MSKINLVANKDMPVIYIGAKRPKIERTYGTKLKFMPGQAHIIRTDIARQLLNHPDVFTTTDTPELAEFVKANPVDAHKQGLSMLSDEELAEQAKLEEEQAKAAEAEKAAQAENDNGMIIPDNDGGDDDDNAMLIADAKAEIEACANKGAIQDWVNENELNIELDGSRPEFEEQAIKAYTASLEAGE